MQPVVFIARLVGPLFVVLGVGILLNQTVYADMIGQAVLSPVLIYLSGLLALARRRRHAQRLSRLDRGLARHHHHPRLAHGDRRHRPHRAAGGHRRARHRVSIPDRSAMPIVGVIVLVIGVFLSFKGYPQADALGLPS